MVAAKKMKMKIKRSLARLKFDVSLGGAWIAERPPCTSQSTPSKSSSTGTSSISIDISRLLRILTETVVTLIVVQPDSRF
jgi:hypothetical protein